MKVTSVTLYRSVRTMYANASAQGFYREKVENFKDARVHFV